MSVQYGCAVLAGGAGRRMGGLNKAALPAQESVPAPGDATDGQETILARLARILNGTGMPCYLSVAAYEQPVPAGWTVVKDRYRAADGGYAGPLAGIASCLGQAAEDGLAGLFFVPCDAPSYEADVIEKMRKAAQRQMGGEQMNSGQPGCSQVDAAIWETADGKRQVAFGWYAVSCLPVMQAQLAEGRYRVQDCLTGGGRSGGRMDGHGHGEVCQSDAVLRVLYLDAGEAGLAEERFRNLNTPDDL